MAINEYFSAIEISEQVYKRLLPDFFKELKTDFKIIESAVERGENSQIRSLAHKIKGCAASYSAIVIFSKAKLLEESAKLSENTDSLKTAAVALKQAISDSETFANTHFN